MQNTTNAIAILGMIAVSAATVLTNYDWRESVDRAVEQAIDRRLQPTATGAGAPRLYLIGSGGGE